MVPPLVRSSTSPSPAALDSYNQQLSLVEEILRLEEELQTINNAAEDDDNPLVNSTDYDAKAAELEQLTGSLSPEGQGLLASEHEVRDLAPAGGVAFEYAQKAREGKRATMLDAFEKQAASADTAVPPTPAGEHEVVEGEHMLKILKDHLTTSYQSTLGRPPSDVELQNYQSIGQEQNAERFPNPEVINPGEKVILPEIQYLPEAPEGSVSAADLAKANNQPVVFN